MRKYTLTDNIISALLGVVIAIPICISSYKNWNMDPPEELVKETYRISVEENYPATNKEVEIKTLTRDEPDPVYIGDFYTTAYCHCEICCGEWADGITYTGTVATEGRTIAVDPDVIPLGSVVEINGTEYVAEDIGGLIDDNRIDIFFETHDEALTWEVQTLPVYMVKES